MAELAYEQTGAMYPAKSRSKAVKKAVKRNEVKDFVNRTSTLSIGWHLLRKHEVALMRSAIVLVALQWAGVLPVIGSYAQALVSGL